MGLLDLVVKKNIQPINTKLEKIRWIPESGLIGGQLAMAECLLARPSTCYELGRVKYSRWSTSMEDMANYLVYSILVIYSWEARDKSGVAVYRIRQSGGRSYQIMRLSALQLSVFFIEGDMY